MVNADDFTYSKGYLGLLSALGASLGITFCCAPSLLAVYNHYRHASTKPKKPPVKVDEENIKPHDEVPDEKPVPMTENSATKTHHTTTRFSVDCFDANSSPSPYRGLRRNHTF